MCKYNVEENKLLGLPEDTKCLLEEIHAKELAEKEYNEMLGLEIKEVERNLEDYYNIKHIPKTLEEINILKEEITKKYMGILEKEPQCRKETIEACKAAEEAYKAK